MLLFNVYYFIKVYSYETNYYINDGSVIHTGDPDLDRLGYYNFTGPK